MIRDKDVNHRNGQEDNQIRLDGQRAGALAGCLILFALVNLLYGCVAESQPTQEPLATPTLPSTATPVVAPTETPAIAGTGAITLTLWYPEHMQPTEAQPGGDVLQTLYQAFTDMYPDLGIVGETKKSHGPGGILDYLRTTSKVRPESLPDLVLLQLEDIPAAASLGILQPLDSVLLDQAVEDLYPFANQMGLFEGEHLAIPYEVDIRFLTYDHSTIDSVPLAWSESLTLPAPYLLPLAEPEMAGADALLLQYYALGGALQDAQANASLDEAKLAEALRLYKGLVDQGLIHSASFTTTNLIETWSLFTAGKAAIAESSAQRFLADPGSPPHGACAPIPTVSGRPATLAEGWAWAIATSDPRRQQGAIALLSWLMEEENLAARCAASSYLPARRSVATRTLDSSKCPDVFAQLLENAYLRPSTETCGAIRKWTQAAMQEVLTGVETPELAAAEIASHVTQLCQAETSDSE